MDFDSILLTALIPSILVLLIMCIISCLRCRRSPPVVASTNIYTVPTNYNAVSGNTPVPVISAPPRTFAHNRISSSGDRFAIPIDLLPATFDYTAPGVEHKGSYVLVKDLKSIEIVHIDEYQKQSPYNPNFT